MGCLMMWWWTFFSCCLAQDAMFTWTVVLYQSQMFPDLTSIRFGACSIYTVNAQEGGKILSTKNAKGDLWDGSEMTHLLLWSGWACGRCLCAPPSTCMFRGDGEEKGGGCRWTLGCERGCWYGTVLLHFLEIETRKAFILHREAISAMQVLPMAHKEFVAELVCQHGDRHSSQQNSWADSCSHCHRQCRSKRH